MTVLEFRLSPAALRALGDYVQETGLGVDEAADTLLIAGVGRLPTERREPSSMSGYGASKDRFLELLMSIGSVSDACHALCISEGLPYGWARTDLEFARAFDQARVTLRERRKADRLEALAV
jgi:hypothetical protein